MPRTKSKAEYGDSLLGQHKAIVSPLDEDSAYGEGGGEQVW